MNSLIIDSLCAIALLAGGEWPQFRGPSGQGIADGPVPIAWSDTENVAWTCDLPGVGHSSPVVWDDTAWLTTATADGTSTSLLGVDLATGKLVHNIELFQPTDIKEIHHSNSYASPTPCVDAEHVYAHFGRYGTAAVDTKTGDIVWKNTDINVWHNSGPASSAILAGGRLILTVDAMEESFLCGLDPTNGKIIWKTPRSAPMRDDPIMHRAFSTPLTINIDNQDLIISPGPDQMNCYVAATGKELWHVRYTGFSTVPTPTTDGRNLYYCTGFFDAELRAMSLADLLDPTKTHGDVTQSSHLWSYGKSIPDTPSPTYANGRIWIVSDKGVLTSVNAQTGERASVGRVRDNVSASPIIAGNHLYIFGESGTTTIWDITGDKPQQVAKNKLASPIKATPAIVNNTLLVRTSKSLQSIQEIRN